MTPRRIAFLVFPRLTFLDFVGAYDALRRIAAMAIDPKVTHRIIGTAPEIVDETGLSIKPDSVYEDLAGFDLLYVSGGLGTLTLMEDRRAIDYLSQHFDQDLTVDAIAEIIDISASHLAHLFRSETGMSVRDYLTRVRVAIAQDLLAGTDEKLEAVAVRVGFVDTSHLAHVFQRITGRPPSAYRRSAG